LGLKGSRTQEHHFPRCTAILLRNLFPSRPQEWRSGCGKLRAEHELVDLPPPRTSSSDAVSIGLE
jgi:hypothetical protein